MSKYDHVYSDGPCCSLFYILNVYFSYPAVLSVVLYLALNSQTKPFLKLFQAASSQPGRNRCGWDLNSQPEQVRVGFKQSARQEQVSSGV